MTKRKLVQVRAICDTLSHKQTPANNIIVVYNLSYVTARAKAFNRFHDVSRARCGMALTVSGVVIELFPKQVCGRHCTVQPPVRLHCECAPVPVHPPCVAMRRRPDRIPHRKDGGISLRLAIVPLECAGWPRRRLRG